MATLTIDPQVSPRLITIAAPDTEITVQEIVNWCREWEQTPDGMAFPYLIDAAGKDVLGGGKFVGITATFKDVQIEFAARAGPSYVECKITDGNLVAVDDVGSDISPLNPTAYVYAIIERATSAAIIETGTSGLTPTESTQLNNINNQLDTIEGSYSHAEVMRIILASLAGKLSGAAGATITIRDTGDTKDRIVATVDEYGNRTSVTIDES